MVEYFKDVIRRLLNAFRIDLTKNLEYDRLTKEIIKKRLSSSSNCIDVGCHKGEILKLILLAAPKGKHFAFEPIPAFADTLRQKFGKNVEVFSLALGHEKATGTFNYVKNAPAYSGLKERAYKVVPVIEKIEVDVVKLDGIIPNEVHIDFIKIDVEGGEMGVLKGGIELLKRDHPLVIFEFGRGASDFYGTQPEQIFDLLSVEANYKVYTLKGFLIGQKPLSLKDFVGHYEKGSEYYFIASA